jgi:hypothetical protein
MSKMSVKWVGTPSRAITRSACARLPLVKMYFLPGRRSSAAASAGSGCTTEWSMS